MKPLLRATRPLGAFVMLPVCELTGDEHLTRAHQRIHRLFDQTGRTRGESARGKLLDKIKREITFHERYEDTVYYPLAFDQLGDNNPIPIEAAEEHAEVRRLLKHLRQEDDTDPLTKEGLVAELKETVAHHIEDEETKLIPAVNQTIDITTAQLLGCQYEQMKDIETFVSQLIDKITSSLSPSLAGTLEIIRGTVSQKLDNISTGTVELYIGYRDRQMYSQLCTLSGIFRDILQPLATHGLDSSIVLYHNDKALAAFISSPNPSFLFVQTYDFDRATPISVSHHRPGYTVRDASFMGARLISFEELEDVLRELSRRISMEPSYLDSDYSRISNVTPLHRATDFVGNVIAGRRLIAPIKVTTTPIIRIAFREDPTWAALSLLHAFSYDAPFVFLQDLTISDAYFGCFEVDFEPTDKTSTALDLITRKILDVSNFDDLVIKYNILRVRLFNFPSLNDNDYTMYFDSHTNDTTACG